MSAIPERLSRRRLLLGAGATGLGLATAAGGIARIRETRSSPPENISFPVGLEITGSDLVGILQRVEDSRDCIYSVRPTIYSGLPLWKFKIAIIDQEKADGIHVGESDWKYVPENIEQLKDEQAWSALIKYAASATVTFPNKTEEIHALIDNGRKAMIHHVQNLNEYWQVTHLPELGFYLQNILGEKVDVPGKKWNEFTDIMSDNYNHRAEWRYTHDGYSIDYENFYDYYDRLANTCAWTKHFAPEKLPDYYFYYPDAIVHPAIRNALRAKTDQDRAAENCDGTIIGDWWRFTDRVLTARMLELDTVKMTPGGLVVA